jgi:hypothetical protein
MLGGRGRSGLTARGRFTPLDGLGFGNGDRRAVFVAQRSSTAALHPLTDDFRHRLIDGAGVGLLLADSELGQHVDNGMGGDLQLPCELIDSNFAHK